VLWLTHFEKNIVSLGVNFDVLFSIFTNFTQAISTLIRFVTITVLSTFGIVYHLISLRHSRLCAFKSRLRPVDFDSDFFSLNDVRTRGHNCKLYLPECKRVAHKFSFARRVYLTWKNLAYDVVNAVSLNSFKCKLANVCLLCERCAACVALLFVFRARQCS